MFEGLIASNGPMPIAVSDPFAINIYLVDNLYQNMDYSTYIKIPHKNKAWVEYTSYRFSANIAFLRIAEYVSPTKGNIIWFNLGENVMTMEKSKITGLKLLDKLAQLGIDFCIDAPKYKRGEAINQLIFKNLALKRPINITDEKYVEMQKSCTK